MPVLMFVLMFVDVAVIVFVAMVVRVPGVVALIRTALRAMSGRQLIHAPTAWSPW